MKERGLAQLLQVPDVKVFLVGGSVRDQLLGLPVLEHDYVVVGADPETMRDCQFLRVGKQFPVFLEPNTHYEFALARTEEKIARGHTGFNFKFGKEVTLADDLVRRDLTINTLARRMNKNQGLSDVIEDHVGGLKDLHKKKLRHVGDAFVEDPLRVLRVARFYCKLRKLGFTIELSTLRLMREIVQERELETLSAERIWRETTKAFSHKKSHRYFAVLNKTGAFKSVMPQLQKIWVQVLNSYKQIENQLNTEQKWILLTCEMPHEELKTLNEALKIPKSLANISQKFNSQYSWIKPKFKLSSAELLAKVYYETDARRKQEEFDKMLKMMKILGNPNIENLLKLNMIYDDTMSKIELDNVPKAKIRAYIKDKFTEQISEQLQMAK